MLPSYFGSVKMARKWHEMIAFLNLFKMSLYRAYFSSCMRLCQISTASDNVVSSAYNYSKHNNLVYNYVNKVNDVMVPEKCSFNIFIVIKFNTSSF